MKKKELRKRVRTLHSYLFERFKCDKAFLFNGFLARESRRLGFDFGRRLSMELGRQTDHLSDMEPETEDDLSYNEAVRLRNLGKTYADTAFSGRSAVQVKRLFTIWEKAWAKGFWDFQRLLEMGAERDDLFYGSYVGFDEANDFTPLMFKIASRSQARTTVIACDPDQSLYTWSGARPQDVFSLEFESTVQLDQTNRVPSVIAQAADKILDGASFRAPGRMKSTREGGSVKAIHSVDLALREIRGTEALVLCRTNQQVEELKALGIKEYSLNVRKDVDLREAVETITGHKEYIGKEAIRQLLSVPGGTFVPEAREKLKRVDSIARDVLLRYYVCGELRDALQAHDASFLDNAVVYNVYDPEKPTVEFLTKHASKGLEADNVVVLQDTTRKVDDEGSRDDEIRLAYVATTRAKKRVLEVSTEKS